MMPTDLPGNSDLALPAGADPAALEFVAALPTMLLAAFERRYLAEFEQDRWQIVPREYDDAPVLLREVERLGRPEHPAAITRAMPHVLNSCHESGQALVMAVHGQGRRHKLYLGGRRVIGAGGRGTDGYLDGIDSAFKAYYPGLTTGPLVALHESGLPDLARLLQSAPALATVTGIPAQRAGAPVELQSLDRLIRAVGQQRYALLVVAQALTSAEIDEAIDRCRQLKSEVHAYARRTLARSRGGSASSSRTKAESEEHVRAQLPQILSGLAVFCQLAGAFVPGMPFAALGYPLTYMSSQLSGQAQRERFEQTQQISEGANWSETGGIEFLNANAEACEALLQQHIERLQVGRSLGWWRTAIYIAAEHEATVQMVGSALRSIASGGATALEPLRLRALPAHLLRRAIVHGQVLDFQPATPRGAAPGHPLGAAFDTLGTCINSDELAVLFSLPQQEVPGMPLRPVSPFALAVPPLTDRDLAIGEVLNDAGQTLDPVPVSSETLNRHVFVTGKTGFGKSTTCKQLLLGAFERFNVPFLVLEPAKFEYRELVDAPSLRGRLRVYGLGPGTLPLRLNPFAFVPGIALGRHIDLLKAVFNAAFPMFAGMNYVLEEALIEIYTERGWNLFTSENSVLGQRASTEDRVALLPTIDDLHDKIDVVLQRKRYGQEIQQNLGAALRARLQSLTMGNKGLLLNTRRSVPLSQLLGGPAVIELYGLGDDEEKAFVLAVLFLLLYEWAERRQLDLPEDRRQQLQHLTLLEEARRLLGVGRGATGDDLGNPRGKAVELFTDMMAEMRAYGEGFIVATQSPTDVIPATLKHTSMKIIHRLDFPHDRQLIGGSINLSDLQQRHLINLQRGEAVIHDELIGEAVLAKVYPLAEFPEPVAPGVPAVDPASSTYLQRHAGCQSCPAPCTFYHQIALGSPGPVPEEPPHPLFTHLLLDTPAGTWATWLDWRGRWDRPELFPLEASAAERAGVLYCRVTQQAYSWLTGLIQSRSAMLRQETPRPPRGGPPRVGAAYIERQRAAETPTALTPRERLQREVAARTCGKLFGTWVNQTVLDTRGQAAFEETRAELLAILGQDPPYEHAGCRQCPARCQMLPFVAPHIAALEARVVPLVVQPAPHKTRLLAIAQAAQQMLPGIEQPLSESLIVRRVLYCLLTNLPVPEGAAAQREELLALVRK